MDLENYIRKKVNGYQIAFPLLVAFVLSISAAYIIVLQNSNFHKNLMRSIMPHIALLIETHDIVELQRFIKMVGEGENSTYVLTENNRIISSTRYALQDTFDFSAIKKIKIPFTETYIDSDLQFINNISIKRENGSSNLNASVVLFRNAKETLVIAFIISIIIFYVAKLSFAFLIQKIIYILSQSLEPIKELDNALKNITNDKTLNISPFPFQELDNIRNTFTETQMQLKNANEKLANEKAKEMTNTAYKNLIHDIHIPITAIVNYIKILENLHLTVDEKDGINKKLVELSIQILNQIKKARSYLAYDISLKNDDLRNCVKKSIALLEVAVSEKKPNILIEKEIEEKNMILPHDPILLGRAISNLLMNAIEAAENKVAVELNKLEDNRIVIAVNDDGPGMSLEQVSLHLQGRGKSSKSEGPGIGLSSANHIVKSHGGKIIYKPSLLGGSRFEIII